ncbi:MAG: thioredoxin domain-containing protein, partial [Thermoplasmata archaeon]|nr:thioredoxin domain-containing protein [Thermoplasmata archaeon]
MAKRARPEASRANRLADEKSPYLLQHADNPVDWYPWGEEAFEAARREDKPIFLSIGYSTCHWCHVMAHESFEDTMVAKMMNDTFVNIKVDREERPDIDGIYMTVCQMMTGTGGWPLTIVMTPDKRPFFAGTYFPKESRFGRAGLTQLVPQLAKVWREQRDEVIESADQITEELTKQTSTGKGDDMDGRFINTAALQLNQRFDEDNGGFGNAPKFPSPHQLTFLLRFWRREADEWSLEMVTRTLKAMRKGGVYDQIGFGFHRYSTDARWLLPHFEKMLYDQ